MCIKNENVRESYFLPDGSIHIHYLSLEEQDIYSIKTGWLQRSVVSQTHPRPSKSLIVRYFSVKSCAYLAQERNAQSAAPATNIVMVDAYFPLFPARPLFSLLCFLSLSLPAISEPT